MPCTTWPCCGPTRRSRRPRQMPRSRPTLPTPPAPQRLPAPGAPVLLLEQRLRKEALRRPCSRWRSPGDPRAALALPRVRLLAAARPVRHAGAGRPCRGRAVAGASERDWLLVIEADGLHRDEDLNLQPLLRQFAVGRVSIQRVSAQSRSLTRWQIPCTCSIPARARCPPCPLAPISPLPGGADTFPGRHPDAGTRPGILSGRAAGPGAP